jgi:hypothetical protein
MLRIAQAFAACSVLTLVVATFASGCGHKYPGKVRAGDADKPNTPCEGSEKCKVWGWCGEKEGECAPTAEEHCRSSALCKKSGLCSLEVGDGHDANRCIAKGDDCDGTDWCKKFSLCDADEGVCK